MTPSNATSHNEKTVRLKAALPFKHDQCGDWIRRAMSSLFGGMTSAKLRGQSLDRGANVAFLDTPSREPSCDGSNAAYQRREASVGDSTMMRTSTLMPNG